MRRLLLALVALFALAPQAAAAEGIRIREASLDPDGSVRLVVQGPGDVEVTEDGRPVEVGVVEALEGSARGAGVLLALDTSGSARGAPLDAARAAARTFLDALPPSVRIGLLTFSDTPRVLLDLTDDRRAVTDAIDGVRAAGETALYDAVALGAETLGRHDLVRHLVVFTDGGDTVSARSLTEAVAAANAASVPVTTVGLRTPELDELALRAIAAETGGRSVAVDDPGGLSAAFDGVAREVAGLRVVRYRATERGPDQLTIAVTAAGTTDRAVVTNPRLEAPRPASAPGFLGSAFGLWGGIAAGAMALALVAWLSIDVGGGREARELRRVLGGDRDSEPVLDAGGLRQAALTMVARIPTPSGYEESLERRIDRAGWPMRATELLALRIGTSAAALLFGAALAGLAFALVLGAAGWFAPMAVLGFKTSRRRQAFTEQLPDTLQLVASSLEAGYGLMQALDAVVQEGEPPTSEELARVLAEVRLGSSMHDALVASADRIGSDDWRWVVMAMAIQREVGGELASLLRTVSETLRERASLRRTVRTLSAEGRLSAVILVVLPVALALYLAVVNPTYLATLTGSAVGKAMLLGSGVLMGVGSLWMRRMIRIEV